MRSIHRLLIVLLILCGARGAQSQLIPLDPERVSHAATLLQSGKVLITGGVNESTVLSSALLYDPATDLFAPTGSMMVERENHTSTLLPDGRVLVTGGDQDGLALQTAEIYDPAAGTFSLSMQGMRNARSQHTATLLADGAVLVVGGQSADVFDPSQDSFTKTIGNPVENRKGHAATSLPDGTVLITGGYIASVATDTAEIYDPLTQTFTATPNPMVIPRANHTATVLHSGGVFITGGFSGTSPHDETEIYDPATQTFTLDTPMLLHRSNHRAVLQGDGQVLVIGGVTLESGFLAANEIYDPVAKTWTEHGQLLENRGEHTATMLLAGNVLVAGGVTGNETLQSAEILDPITHQFTAIGNLQVPRNQHTAILLQDGQVLLTAGSTDTASLASAELFDPGDNSFTLVASTLTDDRKSHTATLLNDGQVLIAGGKNSLAVYLRTAELFDPITELFQPTDSMKSLRGLHTATLLNDGTVVLIGGVVTGGAETDTAETFDPVAESFQLTPGVMSIPRKRHRATLRNDGKVLVSGGATVSNGQFQGDGVTETAELFDPATGTFAQVGDMSVGRAEHDSTLLEDGSVLITGGTTGPEPGDTYDPVQQAFTPTANSMLEGRVRLVSLRLTNPAWGSLQGQVLAIGGSTTGGSVFGGAEQAFDSVEIYNPATNQFSNFGTMTVARQNHTATELVDGRVLITGGVGRPVVSGTAELVAAPSPTPAVVKPLNISTRVDAQTEDNVPIAGFIINGVDVPKKVIVRAIGPSLPLAGVLADPTLELYDSAGTSIATNDDWVNSLDKQAIIDSSLAPSDDKESALIATLSPASATSTGQYTAIVRGNNNTTGIVLVEVYDLDPWAAGTVLANISTRGLVETDDRVMIAGFIVSPGGENGAVLVRGIGPSLGQFIPGVLADPVLDLYDANGMAIGHNDNWKSDQQTEIEGTGIPPADDAEAAILVPSLPAGSYTAIESGQSASTGVGLVEVYYSP